jgi:CBS domain-containing protein
MPQPTTVPLKPLRSSLAAPKSGWRVQLRDPALSVMTDFHERGMVTVDGKLGVDAGLEVMRHAGTRSAFVLDEKRNQVLGLVTAYDIMGEKPLRATQALGISRDEVRVIDVMDRAEDWHVARMEDVEKATVALMLEAFQRTGRSHIAVVEDGDGKEPRLRGVFSAAKLLRLTADDRKPGAGRRSRAG